MKLGIRTMRKLQNEELQRKSEAEFRESAKLPLVLVLDNIRSMLNVGSIFRTADAFLLEAVYLCGITGKPPDREIEKTALGATRTVSWKYFEKTPEAIDELKIKGYRVYAVEQAEDSILLSDFCVDKNDKIALVFGHEVKGVEQEVINACHGCLEVPQLGSKHSLNVSVCAGIVVWEVFRKMSREAGNQK